MAAIAWLPAPDSSGPGRAAPASRIAAPVLSPGSSASLPLGMKSHPGSAVPTLHLLPAPSFLFWEESGPNPEREGSGAPPAGPQRPGEPPGEPDLRLRLLARLQPPLGLCLSPDGVVDWPHELMPFQVQGVRLLYDRDRLLLADKMGLGKTVQALAALRLLALRQEVGSCLVVTPASVFSQWRDQFASWAPELRLSPVRGTPAERDAQWRTPAHAHLVGYETLRADLGQTRPVNVYAYSLEDSVEQRIAEVLAGKRLLFDQVVEEAGIHVGTALTRSELLQAVGLAAPI